MVLLSTYISFGNLAWDGMGGHIRLHNVGSAFGYARYHGKFSGFTFRAFAMQHEHSYDYELVTLFLVLC
jgi:hypothetical protein